MHLLVHWIFPRLERLPAIFFKLAACSNNQANFVGLRRFAVVSLNALTISRLESSEFFY